MQTICIPRHTHFYHVENGSVSSLIALLPHYQNHSTLTIPKLMKPHTTFSLLPYTQADWISHTQAPFWCKLLTDAQTPSLELWWATQKKPWAQRGLDDGKHDRTQNSNKANETKRVKRKGMNWKKEQINQNKKWWRVSRHRGRIQEMTYTLLKKFLGGDPRDPL